jgi:eukaryotic-like serine/threonine-protein kinase
MARSGSTPDEQIRGRYVMFDELASGGMGTVRLGRLVGPVGFARIVAIKQLHANLATDPAFVAMFLDEARLASRIRHPNVVSTLDVVVEGGSVFLVMDYVQGESLSRLLSSLREGERRAPTPVIASVMVGVLHGLHAAHEAKDELGVPLSIVHRDVSPQNIMVGADGVSRILDFGIAHAALRAQTTGDGSLKGKIAYMPPEQIRAEPLDRRADVYAASVVFWEALAGVRMFEGASPTKLMDDVCNGRIAAVRESAPEVPAALEEIVHHGLSRDLNQRFQSARAMAVAVENAVPLATPRQVGEWVEALAAAALARRSTQVSAIESAWAGGRAAVSAGGPRISQALTAVPTVIGKEQPVAPEPQTDLSLSATRAGLPRTGRGRWIALAAGLSVIGATLFLRLRSGSEAAAARVEIQPETGSAPSSPLFAEPPIAAAPSIPPSAPSPVESVASARSGPAVVTTKAAPRSSTPRSASPGAVPGRDSCTPAFVILDGIKHYKPECVQ